MIFAPPQHGKSLLVSTLLPAAWLSRFPNDPVILTSYGSALVEYHSRNSRAIVESPEYQALFPWLVTDQRSRARDHVGLDLVDDAGAGARLDRPEVSAPRDDHLKQNEHADTEPGCP